MTCCFCPEFEHDTDPEACDECGLYTCLSCGHRDDNYRWLCPECPETAEEDA